MMRLDSWTLSPDSSGDSDGMSQGWSSDSFPGGKISDQLPITSTFLPHVHEFYGAWRTRKWLRLKNKQFMRIVVEY